MKLLCNLFNAVFIPVIFQVASLVAALTASLPSRSILKSIGYIPVIFQVASLLAALTHPGHIVLYDIVIYAPGDSLPCCLDPS
ncbi:hypothetical protein [Photorhabdus heterorhabditis]|uniref:hypothetical protein n=1 Tax=Photorhabdus heterorhabditis TaxID=880156 RepID=UPI00156296BB|nr:hypothetical protein [Photorhabdus heterorhabditis]NRN29814.1 hypothetical protein [Photorhabdus heterorhabditis subsp. aluminescens]